MQLAEDPSLLQGGCHAVRLHDNQLLAEGRALDSDLSIAPPNGGLMETNSPGRPRTVRRNTGVRGCSVATSRILCGQGEVAGTILASYFLPPACLVVRLLDLSLDSATIRYLGCRVRRLVSDRRPARS